MILDRASVINKIKLTFINTSLNRLLDNIYKSLDIKYQGELTNSPSSNEILNNKFPINFINPSIIKHFLKSNNFNDYKNIKSNVLRKNTTEQISFYINQIMIFRRYCSDHSSSSLEEIDVFNCNINDIEDKIKNDEKDFSNFIKELEYSKLIKIKDKKRDNQEHGNNNYLLDGNEQILYLETYFTKDFPINKYLNKKITRINRKYMNNLSFIDELFLTKLVENMNKEILWEDAIRIFKEFKEFTIFSNFINTNKIKEIFSLVNTSIRKYNKLNFLKLINEYVGLNDEITIYEVQMNLQENEIYQSVLEEDRVKIFENYHNQIFNKLEMDYNLLLDEYAKKGLIHRNMNLDGNEIDSLIHKLTLEPNGKRISKYPERMYKHLKNKIKEIRKNYK